jgi:hypothetical protein
MRSECSRECVQPGTLYFAYRLLLGEGYRAARRNVLTNLTFFPKFNVPHLLGRIIWLASLEPPLDQHFVLVRLTSHEAGDDRPTRIASDDCYLRGARRMVGGVRIPHGFGCVQRS